MPYIEDKKIGKLVSVTFFSQIVNKSDFLTDWGIKVKSTVLPNMSSFFNYIKQFGGSRLKID